MPMLADVNTSRPPIENGALSASWIRHGDGVGLRRRRCSPFRRMANSSPPSRASASPGRRHDSSRRDDRDEQLVADQVAEAVVDDLEAIEIEIQHREPLLTRRALALVEPAAEPLDEHARGCRGRSANRGSRRCGAAPARSPARSCRSASRRCDRLAAARRAPRRRGRGTGGRCRPRGGCGARAGRPASCPARCASSAALSSAMSSGWTRSSHSSGSADRRRARGRPDHRAPAARDVELLRLQVPLPEAVVGAFRREREPLAAFA